MEGSSAVVEVLVVGSTVVVEILVGASVVVEVPAKMADVVCSGLVEVEEKIGSENKKILLIQSTSLPI